MADDKRLQEQYLAKWRKIGLCTDPMDTTNLVEDLKGLYKAFGGKAPKPVAVVASIHEAVTLAAHLKLKRDSVGGEDKFTQAHIEEVLATDWRTMELSTQGRQYRNESADECCFGSFDASFLSYYDHEITEKGRLKEFLDAAALIDMSKYGMYWAYEKVTIVSDRPFEIHLDKRDRLHNPTSASLKWRDGFGIYCWKGVLLNGGRIAPRRIVEGDFTAKEVLEEPNQEIRRCMLEKKGGQWFVEALGAKVVSQDDWGTLYRVDITGDEPIVVVKVVNSTPEPDGSYKDYFIRVHPELRPIFQGRVVGDPQKMTPKAAIASTFGLREHEYTPEVQT